MTVCKLTLVGRFTNNYQVDQPTEKRQRTNSKRKNNKHSETQGEKAPKSLTKADALLNSDSMSKKKKIKGKRKTKHKGTADKSRHTLGDLNLLKVPISIHERTRSDDEYKNEYVYNADKSRQNNHNEEDKTNTAERNQTNTDMLDVTKQKRCKNIKKMKSVKMKFENIFGDPKLLLDLLQCNDNTISQKILEKYNLSSIPLILNIQYHGAKYEVKFDFNITKDTEKKVAIELRNALNLPEKYDK